MSSHKLSLTISGLCSLFLLSGLGVCLFRSPVSGNRASGAHRLGFILLMLMLMRAQCNWIEFSQSEILWYK